MKIYLDSGSLKDIKIYAKEKRVHGFTTNPSLLFKSGVKDYKFFVSECNKIIGSKSISFEVTADDEKNIISQAKWLLKNSKKSFIKIPIVNAEGKYNLGIIQKLQSLGCKLNVTAIFTEKQIVKLFNKIDFNKKIIISIFAGRIADTGENPLKIIRLALKKKRNNKKIMILWASTREVYNYYEAKKVGCDIITMDKSFVDKLSLKNKNLNKYSKETSKQFFVDGKKIKFI